MVEIKNVEVHDLWKSFRASGYPMTIGDPTLSVEDEEATLKRVCTLGKAKSGSGHDNFLKGIHVSFDLKYPMYFSPELQRYNWIDIVSSQSTMHRLTVAGGKLEFHNMFNMYVDHNVIDVVQDYVENYNRLTLGWDKNVYLTEEDWNNAKYFQFMKAISNLPRGYEMWMGVSTNYLQLKTIYNQRKNHKLKEDWSVFCDMCRELPYFLKLIGEKECL